MSDASKTVKLPGTAALKNVIAFAALVQKIRDRAPSLPNIGVFFGHSGLGKSYASTYAQIKTRAVRVEAGESWNKKTLVSAILQEAGMVEPRGTIAELTHRAIMALADYPDRPLIIDEADKLVDHGHIELVREIADHSQVPVLLIGEEMLPSKLLRYERVHNRVLGWCPAMPCDLEDCKKLSPIFAPGIVIEDDLLELAREKGHGRARRIANSLSDMSDFARNAGLKSLNRSLYAGAICTGEAPSPRSGKLSLVHSGRAA